MSLQKQIEDTLKDAMFTFYDFLSFIRLNYTCNEVWNGKDELRFIISNRPLLTIKIRDGFFQVILILTKAQCEQFESEKTKYSKFIRQIFDEAMAYHDGKWMIFHIKNDKYIAEIQELIKIKREPNRKPEDLTNAIIGKCCRRCDTCAVYYKNREKGSDFSIGAEKVYEDYENFFDKVCKGCATNKDCQFLKCVNKRKIKNCSYCPDFPCDMAQGRISYAGKTAIGITNKDFEEYVLPYCSIERAEYLKKIR
jgi:hypothetical protein